MVRGRENRSCVLLCEFVAFSFFVFGFWLVDVKVQGDNN